MEILRLDSEVEGHKSALLIVVAEGVMLGKVTLIAASRQSAGIARLFVRPDMRRIGVATALMERAHEIALHDYDCQTVGLTLAKDNSEARALYDRLGYVLAYEYDDGSFIMCKRL
jgi:GNAT superfamily N-acetyltransferase